MSSEEQLLLFNQPVPRVVQQLTVNQAITIFRLLHWDRKKMATRSNALIDYIGVYFEGRLLQEIGRRDIEAFRHWLTNTKTLGVSTVNKAHMILTLIYNKCYEWKSDGWAGGFDFSPLLLPPINPCSLVSKPRDPADDTYIVPSVFRKYITYAKRLNDWDMVDNFRMGVWLRLSPIDLENLEDSEVNEDKMQIEIFRRHTKTDKNPTGVPQVIPITEKIWGLINRRRMFRNPGDTKILNFKNKKRRLNKIRKMAKSEGVRDLTWRLLRKAGSGHLYEKGVDLLTRAEGLGHTGTRVAQHHYTPKTKPHLRKSTQILEKDFA